MTVGLVQVGTFIKTPALHVVELLALAGLGFGIVDAEHGPFDRTNADGMMIAGRASGLPLYVRTPDDAAATLLWALDIGATSLIVPHVDTAEQARQIVSRARFNGGVRGFSNSARWGRYGTTGIPEAIAIGDQAEIMVQIESAQALANVDAIAAVEGVAALVIGRADLALSIGLTDMNHPDVMEATRLSIAAARAAGKGAVVVVGAAGGAGDFIDMGATHIVVASDQAFLRSAAQQAVASVAALTKRTSLT